MLSSNLASNQKTQRWALILLINIFETLAKNIDWKGCLEYFDSSADPKNALTKDDRKYFMFAQVNVYFQMLKKIHSMQEKGVSHKIAKFEEFSLELQSNLVQTCRKAPFALSVFGGLVQTHLNMIRKSEQTRQDQRKRKNSFATRQPKWLENVIILLSESSKPLSTRNIHFFMGAGRFLRQMDKKSSEFESLTKSLSEKASGLNQPKKILSLLDEMFRNEERVRNPRLQSKAIRGLGLYVQRKQKSSRVLVTVLKSLLEILNRKSNPNKQNGAKKEKNSSKAISHKKRRFFGEVIEELVNIVLRLPQTKWETEALQMVYSDKEARDTLANSLQFVFKIASKSGLKISKLVADPNSPRGVSVLLWNLKELEARLQVLSGASALKVKSPKASKSNDQEKVRLFGYAKNLIELLASADDDEHLQNIKSKVRNQLLRLLSQKKGYLHFRGKQIIKNLEEAIRDGDFIYFKLSSVEITGVLSAICESVDQEQFQKQFVTLVEELITIFASLPKKVENFEDLKLEMSSQRIFKRLAEFIFPRCKKLIMMFRSKQKGEKNFDYVAQRSKNLRNLVTKLCDSVESTLDSDLQNQEENLDLGIESEQVKINISANRKFLSLIETLEASEMNEKTESLIALLGVFSVRNLFLDDLVKEDLESEESKEVIEEELEEQIEEEIEEEEEDQIKEETSDQNAQNSENPTPSNEDLENFEAPQDALTSSLKDISRFVTEYLEKEQPSANDLQILLDACCVLLTLRDSRIRQQILGVIKAFAEDFDEETVDLVDENLFEDIDEKLVQIEEGVGVKLEPEHLDIGDDIMLDSMDEDETQDTQAEPIAINNN